jgi:hypothetical protein
VRTDNPSDLLASIDNAINDGTIDLWAVDDDGDYSLTDDDRSEVAWMRPFVESDNEIVFSIIGVDERDMTVAEYAKLHSEFLRMLLNEFDSKFITATVTASSDENDSI